MSHLHYIYQYELVATIVCFACMISLLLRNRLNNVKSIVFFILLTATFFAGLLDTISCILINELYQGELNPKLLPLIKTLQTGYLIALNFTPYLWFLYVTSSIGRRKINIKYILIMLIPFLVSLGLIIGNIWLDFIYYVDGNEYLSGPALYVLYVISAGYILYTLFEIIRFRKMLRKTQTIFGISYIVTTILSTISEAVAPTYLIELFVISFHLLLMTINFETESDLREPVTGLYNKTTFMLLSERAYKYGFEREVIIIKLNHIHHLKTTIGIKKYNATLRSIANYLLGFKECFIFDCENGCFLLSFEKKENADITFEHIKSRFKEPFGSENFIFEPMYIKISVPKDVPNYNDLLILAETPHIKPGEQGREILSMIKRNSQLEEAIDRAIENDNVLVYFQPIYSPKENKIISGEALARINDEKLGLISPTEFIPVAERSGKIIELGEIVLKKTLDAVKRFKLQEYGINYVEVNLSVVQMLNSNVYERLSNMIKESGVPTSMINFEITESTLIENFSNVSSIMKKFNDDGITFSLDDFGTGYSNFTYIYEMPFQIIKIDRSILLNADSNEVADKMLNSLVNMLKGINVTVLQEGVETKPQRDKIISYGVDYIQGFLYSKPLPEEDFIEYVKINNA